MFIVSAKQVEQKERRILVIYREHSITFILFIVAWQYRLGQGKARATSHMILDVTMSRVDDGRSAFPSRPVVP